MNKGLLEYAEYLFGQIKHRADHPTLCWTPAARLKGVIELMEHQMRQELPDGFFDRTEVFKAAVYRDVADVKADEALYRYGHEGPIINYPEEK